MVRQYHLLQCLRMGEYFADSNEHLTEMKDLLSIVFQGDAQAPAFLTKHVSHTSKKQSELAEKINILRKKNENDLIETKKRIDATQMEMEQMEVQIKIEEVIYDPLLDDGSDSEGSNNDGVKQSQAKKSKNKKRKYTKKSDLDKCPDCNLDNKTMLGSIDHFVLLVADKAYKVKASDKYEETEGWRLQTCPVCNFQTRSIIKLKLHFKDHLEEAHKCVTHCKECETNFTTV